MTSAISAERYPLYWPPGQPRQRNRQAAVFKVEFARSRDELLHSLKLLGGRGVIISTNIPLRLDGLPYAGVAEPADPGVAVYFDRWIDQVLKPFVIACDTAWTAALWPVRRGVGPRHVAPRWHHVRRVGVGGQPGTKF